LFSKIENGKEYYEAFGGQVTWDGAPECRNGLLQTKRLNKERFMENGLKEKN